MARPRLILPPFPGRPEPAPLYCPEPSQRINFYALQRPSGYICREYVEATGEEVKFGHHGGFADPQGWANSVNPPLFAVIKGLEACGEEALAAEATARFLAGMAEVFARTGTVWENYAPEQLTPGNPAAKDFIGWTGIGPITLLIENVLGLRPDGARNRLVWRLTQAGRHGIRRLRFGSVAADLVYDGRGTVAVDASAPFTLVVNGRERAMPAGHSSFAARPGGGAEGPVPH